MAWGDLKDALGKEVCLWDNSPQNGERAIYLGESVDKPLRHYFAKGITVVDRAVMQGYVVEESKITNIAEDGTSCKYDKFNYGEHLIPDEQAGEFLRRFIDAKYGEKSK